MNLFRKNVIVIFCLLGMLSASLHAADMPMDLPSADRYARKVRTGQIPTPREVQSFDAIKIIFEFPLELRLHMLAFTKELLGGRANADALDRIYTCLYPEDRAA